MDLRSACSYSSESDDFRFDVDVDVHVEGAAEYPMMLPPSLLSSPNEMDMANCFERASMQPTTTYDDLSPSPTPMLKSKWSLSTIGSIREEHERRGPSAKLRLYFGGGGGGKQRGSKNSKVVVPQTPTSMKSPSRTSYPMKSPAAATRSPRGYGYGHGRHSSRESDVMIIGYGHHGNGVGVRRWGSVTPMISDAGSDDSALSSASSGLRRKPIPVEMFLRGGV